MRKSEINTINEEKNKIHIKLLIFYQKYKTKNIEKKI